VILDVKGVCATNDKGLPALIDVDLCIHAGEILCIAGISGNGQRELGETLVGLRKARSGAVTLCGKDITNKSPKHLIKSGIAFVPEDRIGMGLIGSFNAMDNIIMKDYDETEFNIHRVLQRRNIRKRTEELVQDNNIQMRGVNYPVKLMSGGNQQKLLFAREIRERPRVLIATYPSRGLDIGAVEAIHAVMMQEKEKGTAIILISEDLDECFQLADRIAVLHEGRIMAEMPREEATYEKIGWFMLGEGDQSGKPVQQEGGGA
jgi:simple sugar transport system ATP-binding protein